MSPRLTLASPEYQAIHDFLMNEAWLLDHVRFQEWMACLAPDLVYTAPMRQSRLRGDSESDLVRSVQHFDEDFGSIAMRVHRLIGTKSAWAEDPPSRTRRFVSNIVAETSEREDEFKVRSYLLLARSRLEDSELHFLSGERNDVLRLVDGQLKLARREFVPDQAVIGMQNLAIFV